MCLVIDINTLACVFDKTNANHEEFKPVFDWIETGKGKIVYGGKNYMKELGKARRYSRLFVNYSKKGKTVHLNDEEVDKHEKEIEAKVNDSNCDDPHIMAMIAVSKCKVLCSSDKRSYKYIKNQSFYPKGVNRPKIYSKRSCENLLVEDNIIQICK